MNGHGREGLAAGSGGAGPAAREGDGTQGGSPTPRERRAWVRRPLLERTPWQGRGGQLAARMGRMGMGLASRIPQWIGYLWLGWVVSWLLLAVWRKPVERRGAGVYEYGHRVLLIGGLLLLFEPGLIGGWAQGRFLDPSAALLWAGLAAVVAGFGLCYWARFTLGGNWSGQIVLKQEHELIRRGPYARIRHPIYTGLLLAVAGTLAVHSHWGGAAGAALIFVGLSIKAQGEEKLLAPVFGDRFTEHLRQTGRFLPRLRRPTAAGGATIAN